MFLHFFCCCFRTFSDRILKLSEAKERSFAFWFNESRDWAENVHEFMPTVPWIKGCHMLQSWSRCSRPVMLFRFTAVYACNTLGISLLLLSTRQPPSAFGPAHFHFLLKNVLSQKSLGSIFRICRAWVRTIVIVRNAIFDVRWKILVSVMRH